MSIAAPPLTGLFQPPPYPIRLFTVEEYHRLIESNVLTEDDPVELLEGCIVPKMPRKPSHDGTIAICNEHLQSCLPPGWTIRIQSAITLSDSEPEPDLAVIRGRSRSYIHRHPGPADIGLLIEVSDASIGRDRNDKGRIYARAGIPVYWIINLIDLHLEVYVEPGLVRGKPAYRRKRIVSAEKSLALILDGKAITQVAVRDLLP